MVLSIMPVPILLLFTIDIGQAKSSLYLTMLTRSQSISGVATHSVSLHAAVLVNLWTRAFTSCKVNFNGHHLLDQSRLIIQLRYIYCLLIFENTYLLAFLDCHVCVLGRRLLNCYKHLQGNYRYSLVLLRWQWLQVLYILLYMTTA